jgi:hypothetical protein
MRLEREVVMERNDEWRRGRERERERFQGRPEERSFRRWEHGEMGEGRTGAPDRNDYYQQMDRDRWSRPERQDDRERRSAWSSEDQPWAHDTAQWGGRGFQREDDDGGYMARPTRNYDEDRRWRPEETSRGAQYGYQVGRWRPERSEAGSTWGTMGRQGGRPPRDYRRADERIRDEICEMIVRETDVDASEVDLQVASGEVTLTGVVEDRSAKRTLEDVAERVFGVHDVHNNLKVRKSPWRELGERIFGNGNTAEEEAAAQRAHQQRPESRMPKT